MAAIGFGLLSRDRLDYVCAPYRVPIARLGAQRRLQGRRQPGVMQRYRF